MHAWRGGGLKAVFGRLNQTRGGFTFAWSVGTSVRAFHPQCSREMKAAEKPQFVVNHGS